MTDPRYPDATPNRPRPNEPGTHHSILNNADTRAGNPNGVWGWVAGLAAVALIAFIIIAGFSGTATNTADNATSTAPVTTGNAPVRSVTPPSTTGSGTAAPQRSAPQQPSPPPANAQ